MPGEKIRFDDSFTQEVSGLHAISIIGWGVGENIQYDNDKFGPVPYWHCRNSWGPGWGNDNGYFKMAMYPFNKVGQFCKQVAVPGTGGKSKIGSMIFMRATMAPTTIDMDQIPETFRNTIIKSRPLTYYQQTPTDIRNNGINIPTETPVHHTTLLIGGMVGVVVMLTIWCIIRHRRGGSQPKDIRYTIY